MYMCERNLNNNKYQIGWGAAAWVQDGGIFVFLFQDRIVTQWSQTGHLKAQSITVESVGQQHWHNRKKNTTDFVSANILWKLLFRSDFQHMCKNPRDWASLRWDDPSTWQVWRIKVLMKQHDESTGVLCAVRVKGHTLCCVFKHFRVAFYCDGPKQVKGKFIRHFTKLDGKPHLRESMKMVYFVVLPWRCKSTLMLLKVLIAKYEQESCRFKGAVWSSIQFNSNWESSYLQHQWGNNTKCLCKWRNKLFSEDNKKEGGRVRHAQTKYNSIDCVVL